MNLKKTALCLAAAIALLTTATPPAFAAPGADDPRLAKIGEISFLKKFGNFPRLLNANEKSLSRMEKISGKWKTQKVISFEESNAFDDTSMSYAHAMKEAFNEASRLTELAAKSKGKKGDANAIYAFETLAKRHESRILAMADKLKIVETRIKTGELQLDRKTLDSIPTENRGKFKEFLDPKGQEELEKVSPGFLKTSALDGNYHFSFLATGEQFSCAIKRGSLFLLKNTAFVESAEASAAWGCIDPCKKKDWVRCSLCVANAGLAAADGWGSFVKCWNSASGPWAKWQKAWCLAKFIGVLA
jgi:hypothetical protein